MNNFTEAYNYSNQVISSNKFVFDTDLTKRYSLNGSTEAVFFLVNETGNTRFGALRGDFRSDNNLPTLKISQSSYNVGNVNSNDARKAWYNNTKYPGSIVINKYNLDKFQMPVLHLTELKLIRSESAGELNQNIAVAVSDLNQIRLRAYGSSATPLGINSSAALVISTARMERQLEMVAEGDRLQQLKRIGAKSETSQIRNSPWNCPGMVLQFPQGEISNSPDFLKNPEGGCN
ncbi:MAG: RagB/SusD family nutrient uptake outer membrane protein [Pyrinomonadaceae bacterium]|nr:RagB/SusD family nutrient uptake outer membrane protein [Sphingobacteriaceae bacterium]